MNSQVPEQRSPTDSLNEPHSDDPVIEVHLRELSQLFDSLDPSPFHEKDLDHNAEEYIVDSFKESPPRGIWALVLYVDHPANHHADGVAVEDAIQIHFARRSRVLGRRLRQLIRRGVVSLGIGLAFLAAVFVIAQFVVRLVGETALATLLREGLLIIGWVAMWKPLEIFLYDWWPILGERRLYDRLSRIKVRVVFRGLGADASIDAPGGNAD